MKLSKILLIIPAYNEGKNILITVKKVEDYIRNSQYNLDYVVINDGSNDNEEEILQSNGINHVELVQNLGIGGAVQTGYIYAQQKNYDIAVQFDGDGQHDIYSLPHLIDPILDDQSDFTVGSRFLDDSNSEFKSSVMRQLGIKILSWLIKITSKMKILDVTSGYRAGNRKVIDQFVCRYPSQYPEPETYMHIVAGDIRVKEVGVRMYERAEGKSSISPLKGVGYMINVASSILISAFQRKEG